MAFSFVREASTTGVGSATSIVVTTPAAGFAAGNLLVMFVGYYAIAEFGATVTDAAGNTWTRRRIYTYSADNDRLRMQLEIWSSVLTVGLSSGQAVTFNCDFATDPTFREALVAEFSGPNAHDASGAATAEGRGTAIDIDTDRALVASEELRVGLIHAARDPMGAGTTSFTPDASWNALGPLSVSDGSDRWQLHPLYRVVTSGAVHPGGDFASSMFWHGASAVFYASQAGASRRNFQCMGVQR